jgi:glucan-binding repeat-containing protein
VAQKGTWKGSGSKWWYQWSDGGYPKSVFLDISGKTYYFDASGYCVYGWKKIGGKDYYFDSSGAMAKNKWVGNYYLKADGTMARNEWVDGGRYHVDKNGKYDKKR